MSDYLFLASVIFTLFVVIPGALIAADATHRALKGTHRGQR